MTQPRDRFGRGKGIWLILVVALVLGWVGFLLGPRVVDRKKGNLPQRAVSSPAGADEGTGKWKTKHAERIPVEGRTHQPVHLRDFYLRPMDFSGLRLREALENVEQAYQDACKEVGEVPLPLEFVLPEGEGETLACQTGYTTVEAVVHLLAGMSAMRVERKGLNYQFSLTARNGVGGTRVMEANAWDRVVSTLGAGDWNLSPGLQMTLPSPGLVSITTDSARDLAVVDSLLKSQEFSPDLQQKVSSKIVHLPAGAPWELGEKSVLTNDQYETWIRDMASVEGVEMIAYPSVVARPGHKAEVLLVREIIVPSEESEGAFTELSSGVHLDVTPGLLGFGNHLSGSLLLTVPETSDEGKVSLRTDADLQAEEFLGVACSMVFSELAADGSRRVVFLSPRLLDPTGEPVEPRSPAAE